MSRRTLDYLKISISAFQIVKYGRYVACESHLVDLEPHAVTNVEHHLGRGFDPELRCATEDHHQVLSDHGWKKICVAALLARLAFLALLWCVGFFIVFFIVLVFLSWIFGCEHLLEFDVFLLDMFELSLVIVNRLLRSLLGSGALLEEHLGLVISLPVAT